MAFLHAAAQGRFLALGFFDGGHALALGARVAPVPPGPAAERCRGRQGRHEACGRGGAHASPVLAAASNTGSGTYMRSPGGSR